MLVMVTLVACLVTCSLGQVEDLPEPRIVIVGQTGTGKSTLANVFLGESPNCKNCTFEVCDSHDSCTKNTKYAIGKWLGSGQDFTVVDTPGFGDSDNEDTELIDEMMGVLHTVVKSANAIVLLFNGQDQRFDASFQQMMREMQALFGEEFWLNTMIGVSFWPYHANSIKERNFTGDTEEKFMAEMNVLLKEKLHMKENLSGVFIDSWSQQPFNLDDALQQEAYKRETEKLWNFSLAKDVFPFRTIEDVLEENQNLKAKNQWLNDVITTNITELTNQISALTATHTEDMAEISKELATYTEDMAEISREISTLNVSIREDISALNTSLAPIGTIIAWTMKPNLNSNGVPIVSLPDGWVECDGQEIPEGIWSGQKTPAINGDGTNGFFLRGGHAGKVLQLEDDQVKELSYTDYTFHKNPGGFTCWSNNGAGACMDCSGDCDYYKTSTISGTEGDETRPKNIRVVYIMKIK